MLNQLRFVTFCLGAIPSLVSVRSLEAQSALTVNSISVRGEFDTSAECLGLQNHPAPNVISSSRLTPVVGHSQALTSNIASSARATSQATATFFHSGNGGLQITGNASIGTLGTVLLETPLPGDQFAAADATGNLEISIGFEVSRWGLLSFAGSMTVSAVATIGSPEYSSATLVQSWALRTLDGREIVQRSLAVSSNDRLLSLQDIHYNSVLVGPGSYVVSLRINGDAHGTVDDPGVSGWTCTGTYGLGVAMIETCAADWDRNNRLDSRDFFEFLNAYFLEAADFNEDAVVDSRDLFDYVNAFMLGCR